jgi:hypothetical protein
MSKHTPGQWEARWSERGQYWFIDHEQGGEGYTLTKLNCEEADACLIAAAPDLLAALRAAEEWAEHIEDDESRVPVDVRLAMRAAIAKATGEDEA